jgi:hypothetical protein
LRNSVSQAQICPKYSADAAVTHPSVLKYKPSPRLGQEQGAETVHFAPFSCAKSHKMWRRGTLLFWHARKRQLLSEGGRSKVLSMKVLIVSAVCAFLWLAAGNAAKEPIQTFTVERPTILAFFPPVTDADLDQNPDTNEALGDFQLYATRVSPSLKKAGIDFEVVSAVKFKVKNGANVRTFRTGKIAIGY